MPLTVLNVAFPLAAVGPNAIGGAEQVLSQLDRALVARGHRSIVVAVEGSVCAGEHLATPAPPAVLDGAAWARAHEAQRRAVARALAEGGVDVVHMHGVDFHRYLPPPGPPTLVTLHLPVHLYPEAALRPARPRTFLNCVSAWQRALLPESVPLVDDVPNGVDLDLFRPARRKRGYALAMGRICEEKGFHLALDAAARASVPIVLAGKVFPFPAHVRYFERAIRPRLGPGRRFAGPADLRRKRRLLAGARCAVVPSLEPETCSLVALEALASGTPVVAFRRGALPGIVEDGVTGFLVDSVEEMASALQAAARLSPDACRRSAEQRFGEAQTVDRYLALYTRLADEGRRRGDDARPRAVDPAARAARSRPPSRPQSATGPSASGFATSRQAPGAGARAEPAGAPEVPGAAQPATAPGPRAAVRLEGIATYERLEELEGAWSDLWVRAEAATPFSSPAWLLPWCRVLAREPPASLAAFRGGDLVGLAPTFVYLAGEERVLGLLGGGVSDYQDALADDASTAVALLGRIVSWRGERYDRLDLEALPAWSPVVEAARSLDVGIDVSEQDACPVLPLAASVDATTARFSAKLRHDVRLQRRKLSAEGGLAVVRATPESSREPVRELFRLHRARWEARGHGSGVLADDDLERFHLESAPALARAGLLRLLALRAGGRTLGVLHGLSAHGRAAIYLTGVDPAFLSRSPGNLLVAQAIEDAVAEGARELDFLRGRESHKYRWGARDRPTLRLVARAAPPRTAARLGAKAGT